MKNVQQFTFCVIWSDGSVSHCMCFEYNSEYFMLTFNVDCSRQCTVCTLCTVHTAQFWYQFETANIIRWNGVETVLWKWLIKHFELARMVQYPTGKNRSKQTMLKSYNFITFAVESAKWANQTKGKNRTGFFSSKTFPKKRTELISLFLILSLFAFRNENHHNRCNLFNGMQS